MSLVTVCKGNLLHLGKRMKEKLQGYITFFVENSLLLILGTATGLIWANVNPGTYSKFSHYLHFVINDIGMAFFFGIAAKEVFDAVLPGGPLASRKEAAMPVMATIGGMVAPAFFTLSVRSCSHVPI
jgi:Na+:H+ antiporter, NhaA family